MIWLDFGTSEIDGMQPVAGRREATEEDGTMEDGESVT